MAVFFATSNSTIGGVDFTAFSIVDLLGTGDRSHTTGAPNTYRLTNPGDSTDYNEFSGVGFTYDPAGDPHGKLTGGTINSFVVVQDGVEVYRVTNLLLDAATANTFLDASDSPGFLAFLYQGNDNLAGSQFSDHLFGYDGGDTLAGGQPNDAGADTLEGGKGMDVLAGLGGDDSLAGGEDADRLSGGAGQDSLAGGAGNDTLDGGTGDDSMDGGAGSDTYVVDSKNDVAEDSGPGTDIDTVQSSVTYTIDASIENLTLTGTAAINGTGNASANVLTGNGNANTLDGATGADTMQGGAGNDTYIVDDAGDRIVENKGAGIDAVLSSVTYGLAATAAANVEILVLTGSAKIDGAGNELDNFMGGNDADNKLEGLGGRDTLNGGDGNDTLDGGAGIDSMIGGKGDDVYYVDNALDVIVEKFGEGNDTVRSTITYSIAAAAGLNNIELLGFLDLNGTGNGNANRIAGNDGKNILDGGVNIIALEGDTLAGGKNDDTYIVHNVNDQVVEDPGAGYDIVKSSIGFKLADNLEELQLTGTAAIDGTGNALANKLTGNAAANKLDGGLGDDTMIGAAGDDTYVVDSAKDVITDSSGVNDEVFFIGADPAVIKTFANVEHYNFSLFGAGPVSFTGTTAANRITGTALDDSLAGGAGNDTLDGGAGNDTMDGGAGNDTYVIDAYTDKIMETGKDAGDTVQTGVASLHIDLNQSIFAGIENVTFTGKEDLNATGNAGNNVLTGNAGTNLLDGGKGNDTLVGGAGNDIYVVDVAGDKVVEGKAAGIDEVDSAISYVLGANLEVLVLAFGTANLNGTGSDLDNKIFGNGGNNLLDGKVGADTIEGFNGNDIYIVDNTKDQVVEAKDAGYDIVKSSATFTLGDNVEELLLTGIQAIDGTGNADPNKLTGNSNNNVLDGLAGADTMKGLGGNDTYVVDNLGDVVSEAGGSGPGDTVVFKITDQSLVHLISGIENYDFSGFKEKIAFAGDAAGNLIIGTAFDDTLAGNGGNDTLDGGRGGDDSLTGGVGNDTYVIDSLKDTIVELKNGGTDTIVSLLPDFTLPDPLVNSIENLTLAGDEGGTGTGNSAANFIRVGNGLDNLLLGLGGNDTIFGGGGNDTLDGGAGNDSLAGSFGNDTYILDSKSDKVAEAALPGTDTVIAPFDYTLGANVENLVLAMGTAAKTGIGNELQNFLTGNELDNVLDGKAGFDSYAGGKGNDTYIVDFLGETVTENAGEGIDTVKASSTFYSLGVNVENLTFTSTKASQGFGNASDNLMIGNAGNDTLQGDAGNDTLDGGAGTDKLIGGADNDTYIVDNAKDVIQEFDLGGTDTIQAKISIDLSNYKNGGIDVIENVTLTGTGALNATGSALGNHLIGNDGANILDGKGGADTIDGGKGNDILIGGQGDDQIDVSAGNDVVRYTSALDGHDIVSGFDGNAAGGQDTLNLDALFDSLAVAAANRAGRVSVVDNGATVDIQVDADGNAGNGFELTVATLNTADDVTVGADVIVGTL